MRKKVLKIFLGVIAFALLAGGGIAYAQDSSYFRQVFKLSGTAMQPYNSAWTLGSSGTPIANGYFTALTAGTLTISSTVSGNLSVGGVILNSNGTAAAPSYTFTSDPNTGLYSYSSDILGISAGGNIAAAFAAGVTYTDTLYSNNASTLTLKGRVVDGASAVGATIGSTNTLSTSGAKIASFVNNTTEKLSITKDGYIYAPDGAFGNPSYSFTSDPDTGIYWLGSGQLGFVSNGAVKAELLSGGLYADTYAGINDTTLTFTGIKTDGASSVAVTIKSNATYSTAGSKLLSVSNAATEKLFVAYDGSLTSVGSLLGTVIYSSSGVVSSQNTGTNLVVRGKPTEGATAIALNFDSGTALTTAGAKIANFTNNTVEKAAIGLNGEVMAGAGTTSLPGLSFLGDPNTGIYNSVGDRLDFTIGGSTIMALASGTVYYDGQRSLSTTHLTLRGANADGSSAYGLKVGNSTALTTAGAKIIGFFSDNITTEKAFIDKDGAFSSDLGAATIAGSATTFAAQGNTMVVTGDAGGNTVATITAGIEGQRLTLLFVDNKVTITDTDAHTANTVDLSAAFTSADDTTLTIVFDGTSWYEVSRSVN